MTPTHDPAFAPTVDSDVIRQSTTYARPARLLSLDVLRGVTIAFMILVNNQAGPRPFTQLSHAEWNGFTATDLVFPTFLLLVGLSTVLSTAARLARGATRRELFLHTCRRALLLLLFGFVVNNFPYFHPHTLRFYGVLPRIGLCYFVVATLYLIRPGWKDKLAIAIACLLGYWALMRFVPIPGAGVPTHGFPINDPDLNLTAWLDRQIFAPGHLYQRVRDPEGLLSTIPSIATALFGLLAGLWLRTTRSTAAKATGLAVAGALMLAISLAWNPYFPINKKLWTSPFALCAGGLSLLLLSASILIVDLWRVGRPATDSSDPAAPLHPALYRPILVLGTNSILAYMVSELGIELLGLIHPHPGVSLPNLVYAAYYAHLGNTQWASLAWSLTFLLPCWLITWVFYRKRIFLRI